MKIRTILLTIALCFLLVPFSYASYWSIGYDDTQEVSAGDVISIDLNFSNEEDASIWVAGFDVIFSIDATELDPVYIAGGPNAGYDIDYYVGGSLYENWNTTTGEYNIAGADLSNWYEIDAYATYTVATLYFTVFEGATLDGFLDVVLLNQIDAGGAHGIEIYNDEIQFGELVEFSGADGPDIGSPVPVPAAALLLGSGLVGLVGLSRRNR